MKSENKLTEYEIFCYANYGEDRNQWPINWNDRIKYDSEGNRCDAFIDMSDLKLQHYDIHGNAKELLIDQSPPSEKFKTYINIKENSRIAICYENETAIKEILKNNEWHFESFLIMNKCLDGNI